MTTIIQEIGDSTFIGKIPLISDDTWTNDSPVVGSIAWNAHILRYNGITYTIAAGSTSDKYIYWDGSSSSYSTSATAPALTDDQFIIATNISGIHSLAYNKVANQHIGTIHIADLAITDAKIANLSADKINAGSIRGINVQSSSFMTQGTYLTAALSGGESVINVKDTTDFTASGSGWFIDSTNDRDAFSWTGKTAVTLTGCSGVLAHNNGAVVVPQAKNIVISDFVNEIRFYDDMGSGTIDEAASIGTRSSSIGYFGNTVDSAFIGVYGLSYSNIGIEGESSINYGVYGISSSSDGVHGTSSTGYSVVCDLGANTKAPLKIVASALASAPSHTANKGSIWIDTNGNIYININGSTTWAKIWHSSNDGSGSGLDADTVDGKNPGSASGIATLNSSTLVVENPANAVVTAAASKIVKAGTAGKIDTGWFSRYESSQQTITSAGALTLAHGLTDENGTAVAPWGVQVWLVCQTAEAGFVAGEWILIHFGTQETSLSRGVICKVDSTNLYIKYGSQTGSVFDYLNFSTGTTANLTNGNWKAVFRAWA